MSQSRTTMMILFHQPLSWKVFTLLFVLYQPTANAFLLNSTPPSTIAIASKSKSQSSCTSSCQRTYGRQPLSLLYFQNSHTGSPLSPLPNSSDPYIVLNIHRQATMQEIKRAYRVAALQYHPDVLINASSTEEERDRANDDFARINAAYAILTGKVPSKPINRVRQTTSVRIDPDGTWYRSPANAKAQNNKNEQRHNQFSNMKRKEIERRPKPWSRYGGTSNPSPHDDHNSNRHDETHNTEQYRQYHQSSVGHGTRMNYVAMKETNTSTPTMNYPDCIPNTQNVPHQDPCPNETMRQYYNHIEDIYKYENELDKTLNTNIQRPWSQYGGSSNNSPNSPYMSKYSESKHERKESIRNDSPSPNKTPDQNNTLTARGKNNFASQSSKTNSANRSQRFNNAIFFETAKNKAKPSRVKVTQSTTIPDSNIRTETILSTDINEIITKDYEYTDAVYAETIRIPSNDATRLYTRYPTQDNETLQSQKETSTCSYVSANNPFEARNHEWTRPPNSFPKGYFGGTSSELGTVTFHSKMAGELKQKYGDFFDADRFHSKFSSSKTFNNHFNVKNTSLHQNQSSDNESNTKAIIDEHDDYEKIVIEVAKQRAKSFAQEIEEEQNPLANLPESVTNAVKYFFIKNTATTDETVSIPTPAEGLQFSPFEACAIIDEHYFNPKLDKQKAMTKLISYHFVPVTLSELNSVYRKFKNGKVSRDYRWGEPL